MASKLQHSTGVHRTWPNKDCVNRPYGWHLNGGALHACCHGKGCRVLNLIDLRWHPNRQDLHTMPMFHEKMAAMVSNHGSHGHL